MRALVTRLRDDGLREKALVHDWPSPEGLKDDQVRTRTLYSGVTNGSERNDLIRGNYAHAADALPAPWGYQNVGEVIEIGPAVTKLKVGDILYLSSDHVEYAVFDEKFLYCRVPENVPLEQAALFGMTSVAMRTCRHADVRMGEKVLVVGAGIIGQATAQIATVMGGRVTICDLNEARLDLARSIGAAERIVNTGGDGWKDAIEDFNYDVIVDVAGVPGMEDALIAAAKSRGRIMFIAGRHKVQYTFNTGQIHEITIKQNSHFDNYDLANLARLVARGQVVLEPLVQKVLPVEEAKGFYDQLRDAPDGLLGTVFKW